MPSCYIDPHAAAIVLVVSTLLERSSSLRLLRRTLGIPAKHPTDANATGSNAKPILRPSSQLVFRQLNSQNPNLGQIVFVSIRPHVVKMGS